VLKKKQPKTKQTRPTKQTKHWHHQCKTIEKAEKAEKKNSGSQKFFSSKGCPPHGQLANAVGGLGSEGDKTVLLGPKNWNPISSSKCTVLARHG